MRFEFLRSGRAQLAMATILLAGIGWSQTSPEASSQESPATAAPSHAGGKGPCWQQAGMSKATMEQFHAIERDTHAQMDSVRNNQSLAPRQRQQQMAEIRHQAMQKRDALLSPDQQSKLRACQQEHGGGSAPDVAH